MAQFRKSENPAQGFLLPPSPREWLSPGHLAWFIQDAVAELDIDKLIDAYRVSGKGELPYLPRVMLQLLIYAYCTGTFSSRKIADQVEDSIAFRVLAEGHGRHRLRCDQQRRGRAMRLAHVPLVGRRLEHRHDPRELPRRDEACRRHPRPHGDG